MAEWLYKATNAVLNRARTKALARRGFLCRSAYNVNGHWIANVRAVKAGDIIHFYFREGQELVGLGAYEVVLAPRFEARNGGPPGSNFQGPVPETGALYEVVDATFIQDIDKEGAYKPDRKLGRFTGWLIECVGDAAPPPNDFARHMATLAKRDVPLDQQPLKPDEAYEEAD